MTRTPTAYVDNAARALHQARTYLIDDLARIDAALAALDLEHTEVTIKIDADARLVEKDSKTYPCTHPGCGFVGKSPGSLGGHRNKHRLKPSLADGEPVHVCDECGETFPWRSDLARHRRDLGHNTDGDDQ